jgi:predicted nucleotidyltransferase
VTRDAIRSLLEQELPRIVPGLSAAYLFGSQARNEAKPGSDVDIGLLYERLPPSTLAARPFLAAAELESLLGRRVDAVVMNDAPPDLVHRVLRDGIVVFEADRRARIAFEVRARNDYFDLLPILARYRRTERA